MSPNDGGGRKDPHLPQGEGSVTVVTIWTWSGSIRTGSVSPRGGRKGGHRAETWLASRTLGRSRRRPGFEIDRSGLLPAGAAGPDRRVSPRQGAPADDRAGNRLAGHTPGRARSLAGDGLPRGLRCNQ